MRFPADPDGSLMAPRPLVVGDRAVCLLVVEAAQRHGVAGTVAGEADGERAIVGWDPGLVERLRVPGYQAKIERAVVFALEAYDWNCSQHITPRFSEAEWGAIGPRG